MASLLFNVNLGINSILEFLSISKPVQSKWALPGAFATAFVHPQTLEFFLPTTLIATVADEFLPSSIAVSSVVISDFLASIIVFVLALAFYPNERLI